MGHRFGELKSLVMGVFDLVQIMESDIQDKLTPAETMASNDLVAQLTKANEKVKELENKLEIERTRMNAIIEADKILIERLKYQMETLRSTQQKKFEPVEMATSSELKPEGNEITMMSFPNMQVNRDVNEPIAVSELRLHSQIHNEITPEFSAIDSEAYKMEFDQSQDDDQGDGVALNYQCGECEKKFANARNLNRHMYLHSGVKPFKCEICGVGLSRRDKLTNHMKRVHKKNIARPISKTTPVYQGTTCTECGLICFNNSTLNRHMRTHTGEKPFKCDECDASFSRKDKCDAHAFKKHNITTSVNSQVNYVAPSHTNISGVFDHGLNDNIATLQTVATQFQII